MPIEGEGNFGKGHGCAGCASNDDYHPQGGCPLLFERETPIPQVAALPQTPTEVAPVSLTPAAATPTEACVYAFVPSTTNP